MVRGRFLLPAVLVAGAVSLASSKLYAESGPTNPKQVSGLWLTTAFPERTADFGEPIKIDLGVENKGLPPERVQLSVAGLPRDWKAEFDGDGTSISAAMVDSDAKQRFSLTLTPPKEVKAGTYAFEVMGKVDGPNDDPSADPVLKLPLALNLAAPKPAKLTFEPKLPDLRGTAKSSFDYELKLKNDSLKDTVVNFSADAPPGFEVAFTEGYGSQEITSLPVKARESKTIKAKVSTPQSIAAGQYQVAVAAQSDVANAQAALQLDVTGQPKVALAGPNGMLSGTATAGEERDFTFKVGNTGTDAAKDVSIRASVPTGWKVETEPKMLAMLGPNETQDIKVRVTPSNKAVAGDYMMNVRASGKGVSNNADFRVTVTTSTLWGATGIGLIAASLLVLVVGVRKYGRR